MGLVTGVGNTNGLGAFTDSGIGQGFFAAFKRHPFLPELTKGTGFSGCIILDSQVVERDVFRHLGFKQVENCLISGGVINAEIIVVNELDGRILAELKLGIVAADFNINGKLNFGAVVGFIAVVADFYPLLAGAHCGVS